MSNANILNSTEEELSFDLSLEISDLEPDTYYHLSPYITNNPLHFDKIYFEVEETSGSDAALFDLVHADGILIDVNSLNDKNLDLKLSTANVPSFDPDHIFLTLRTVTRDYYEYHKTLTLQEVQPNSPLGSAIPSYTNIERGQGIFVAFTSKLDSVLVK